MDEVAHTERQVEGPHSQLDALAFSIRDAVGMDSSRSEPDESFSYGRLQQDTETKDHSDCRAVQRDSGHDPEGTISHDGSHGNVHRTQTKRVHRTQVARLQLGEKDPVHPARHRGWGNRRRKNRLLRSTDATGRWVCGSSPAMEKADRFLRR